MIIIDICLSDIPASARKQSDKNKKWYCKLTVDARKEPDQYGNTHTVYINQSKEERDAKTAKVYVGNGKELVFNAKPENKPVDYEQLEDDLPF